MYQLCLEECDQQKLPERFNIKKSSYSKLFRTEFNLSYGHPKSDICSTCVAGDSIDEHKDNYHAEIDALKADKERSKSSDHIVFITIDLQHTTS
ncbi:hypothetical protein JTB14_007440 [Gonioctena quinquepunctata]|nr:hypothetical protein JTB14_007440 [Gonioctena quinquepunctata]